MSRTIKDLSEGQIIYLEETVDNHNNQTTYVPYIYLGLDEIGNAIILRKELAGYRKMNNVNIAEYIGCDMDLYLNNMRGELWKTTDKQEKIVVDYTTNGFLSRFDEATRNAFTRTQIKHYILNDETTVTLDRECFLLSYTNLGFAKTPDEGKSYLNALKIANNTMNEYTARIAYDSFGNANWYWTSSEFSEARYYCCGCEGFIYNYLASGGDIGLRPALSVLPSTIVSEQGEKIIYLLPEKNNNKYECDFVKKMTYDELLGSVR